MTDFQSVINYNQALGVVGEVAFSGPQRAVPYNLVSTPNANVIGNAFTVTNGGIPDSDTAAPNAGTATVGGTGVFAGILMSPKEYASFGGSAGPLSATITLADNKIGYLMTMGYLFASLGTPNNNVGNKVYYDNTSGALGSYAPNAAFTGALAAGGAGVEDQLTVTLLTAGVLGIGSMITGTGVLPGTYITARISGTGGNGTYRVNTVNLQTVAAVAMTGISAAPANKTDVPRCVVSNYDSSATAASAGSCNAVIQLTN